MSPGGGPEWRVESCAVCETPMPERLWLLTECRRGPDGEIQIVSPALAKLCGSLCLLRWGEKWRSDRIAEQMHREEKL